MTMRRTPLRFGVMCAGTTLPAWQVRCLDALSATGDAEPVVLIVDDREPGRGRALRRLRSLVGRRTVLWWLFERRFVGPRSAATKGVDCSTRFASLPQLRCRPETRGKYSEYFSEADVEAILGFNLDVIVRFGFGIIRGKILDAARHGVWSYHHGDERRFRGGPAGFWEIVKGEPTTGTILQRLTDRLDAGIVLHRGTFKTLPHSYRASRDATFIGAAGWVARVAREVAVHGVPLLQERSITSAPIARAPGNIAMVDFLMRQSAAWMRWRSAGVVRAEHWNIGIIDMPVHALLEGSQPAPRWLPPPPRGTFLADPFGHADVDGVEALAEAYDHRHRRGEIVRLDVVTGATTPAGVPLPAGLHASYPFLVTHGGDLYCVPEVADTDSVRLYRRLEAGGWEEVATLIAGAPIVDATVFQHEGCWWLLGTRKDDDPNANLHGWWAQDMRGPWHAHALNPLKSDVRSARPAGTPFTTGGRLIRPAQDCSRAYGGAVILLAVTSLSPTSFAEEPVGRLAPDPTGPYPDGLHTLSAAGDLVLIDGNRFGFSAAALRRVARQGARRAGLR